MQLDKLEKLLYLYFLWEGDDKLVDTILDGTPYMMQKKTQKAVTLENPCGFPCLQFYHILSLFCLLNIISNYKNLKHDLLKFSCKLSMSTK